VGGQQDANVKHCAQTDVQVGCLSPTTSSRATRDSSIETLQGERVVGQSKSLHQTQYTSYNLDITSRHGVAYTTQIYICVTTEIKKIAHRYLYGVVPCHACTALRVPSCTMYHVLCVETRSSSLKQMTTRENPKRP
jgi:hypothetical protein